jgi:hypothetical protein
MMMMMMIMMITAVAQHIIVDDGKFGNPSRGTMKTSTVVSPLS